eukprot:GHVQ01023268.1.p1 GENE.GHVQ01023268.1~~GHVQ01023268.1.p1  ORF type:complete len:332 (+),score=39.10 GHVQ01023268.1:335-1330(+)
MTQDFPDASRKVNHSSLGEFNAYIDCLDSTRTSDGKAQAVPFSGRSLCFFKQYKTSLGRIIPGRVQVFTVTLPSIRLDATYIEKEFIATRLIRDLQVAVELNTVAFQTRPTPPPLFSIGNVTKDNMEKLWDQNIHEAIEKSAVYQPHTKYQRRIAQLRKSYKKVENRLLAKALKTRDKRTRRRRLQRLEDEATKILHQKFGPEPEKPPNDVEEQKAKVRIIEGGYHPDLVFVHPSLSKEQKTEAMKHVCGANLKQQSDIWLLENIWKAMRKSETPVPIILSPEQNYCATDKTGFIVVPFNFDVWLLADFLEEKLEDVRIERHKMLQSLREW